MCLLINPQIPWNFSTLNDLQYMVYILSYNITFYIQQYNNIVLYVQYREEPVFTYDIVVGPRLGTSNSKEQYAYVYRWAQ